MMRAVCTVPFPKRNNYVELNIFYSKKIQRCRTASSLSSRLKIVVTAYFVLYRFIHLSGRECNESTAMATIVDKNQATKPVSGGDASEPGTIIGIILVVILGAIILVILIYCKYYRRYKRRKTEMAHVHYIADPHIQPGKSLPLKLIRVVNYSKKT